MWRLKKTWCHWSIERIAGQRCCVNCGPRLILSSSYSKSANARGVQAYEHRPRSCVGRNASPVCARPASTAAISRGRQDGGMGRCWGKAIRLRSRIQIFCSHIQASFCVMKARLDGGDAACSTANPPAAAGLPLNYLAKSLAKLLETARRELDSNRETAKASLVTACRAATGRRERSALRIPPARCRTSVRSWWRFRPRRSRRRCAGNTDRHRSNAATCADRRA
jgi:hypothetical protein